MKVKGLRPGPEMITGGRIELKLLIHFVIGAFFLALQKLYGRYAVTLLKLLAGGYVKYAVIVTFQRPPTRETFEIPYSHKFIFTYAKEG